MRTVVLLAVMALGPVIALAGATPAWAQPAASGQASGSGQTPVPSQARDALVLRSCKAEIIRYCPRDEGAPARSGRNAAICLKSVRSSLSAPCRRAVKLLFP